VSPQWFGMNAVAWVLDHAPKVPAALVSTLVAVARHANNEGCNAYPSVPTIASATRKSERQVKRDLAELRQLGLLLPGDVRIVEKLFPADRRPAIYDLPLHLRRGDTYDTSRGDMDVTARGDMEGETGCHTGSDGVSPTTPKEEDLKKKTQKDSSSGRTATLDYVCKRLDLDEDDASLLIQEIKDRHHPDSIGAYLRKMADAELCEVLADLLAAASAPAPNVSRADFARSLHDMPACVHGTRGGHVPYPPTGWVACAIERNNPEGYQSYTDKGRNYYEGEL
jgi:hypothetical protein